MLGPRPRLTEEQTRMRLLDVACERLVQQGLTVGLDAIRMEQVIVDAGVSRASAYRCWPHRDDFLADVLVEAVHRTSLIPEDADDIDRLASLWRSRRADFHDPQVRRDVIVEGLRMSLDADIRRMLASPGWRLFMALSLTHATLPNKQVRETVGASLISMETAMVQRRADVYAGLLELIGHRLRAPWSGAEGLLTMSQAMGLTMRGVMSRALGDPAWLDRRSMVQPFGTSVATHWSQAEIALAGMLLGFIEPDPDVHWDAATIDEAGRRFATLAASLGTEVHLDD